MLGIVAYILVFLLMDCRYLEKPHVDLLAVLVVIVVTFVMGVLFPFLGNYTLIGGLVFGFFLSWIVVQSKYVEKPTMDLFKNHHNSKKLLEQLHSKQECTRTLKIVMIIISIPLSICLFASSLLLFYVGQLNWFDFIYFNCIPYTPTFCLDYGQTLQSRNQY